MGNSACQKANPSRQELVTFIEPLRTGSKRPFSIQPPGGRIQIEPISCKNGVNAQNQQSLKPPKEVSPRLSNNNILGHRNSYSLVEEVYGHNRSIENCGSVASIKSRHNQSTVEEGQRYHQIVNQHQTRQKSNSAFRSNMHNNSTNSKLPSRIEQFLHKQVVFAEKRQKSLQRLRRIKQSEIQKQNPNRPQVNSKSTQIVEQKYNVMRQKLENKQMLVDKSNTLNFTFHDQKPAAKKQTTSITSKSQVEVKLDECLKNLGLTREGCLSFMLFTFILKELHIISLDHYSIETLPTQQKSLLQKAWMIIKEPNKQYAQIPVALNFIQALAGSQIKGPPSLRQIQQLFKQYQSLVHQAQSYPKVQQQQQAANKQSFDKQTQRSQLSILCHKTLIQLQVKLGECSKTVLIDRKQNIRGVSKKFAEDNDLGQQAEQELVRLIQGALKQRKLN